jgi:hypothetical protein
MLKDYEIYVKYPTPFLVANWKRLLPDCPILSQSMAIIFLKTQLSLDQKTEQVEQEKEQLLSKFFRFGERFKKVSDQKGFFGEVISPQDGKPQYSKPGELSFDLVAIANSALGLSFHETVKGCKMLDHPRWKNSVYPGLLIAEISPQAVKMIIAELNGI